MPGRGGEEAEVEAEAEEEEEEEELSVVTDPEGC
jgi:hypothetical protein